MLPAQPNQSLIDGLSCLQALASVREPIGTRELARLLDLEPTRVNRLLKTLAYLGLAEQDGRRKYRPGPAIHILAAQSLFGSGLIQRAIVPLEELEALGHIVAMGILWRDQTCYLYHARPGEAASHRLGHGRLFPAASSGLGMAMLAHRPEAEIRDLYATVDPESPLGSAEPLPLDGEAGLLVQLDRIREQGYALVQVPNTPNRTLGVTLGDPPYAAIGLSGGFTDAEVAGLVAALHDTVERIDSDETSSGTSLSIR